MAEVTFEECLPVEEHAKQVLEWRNDPISLKMSYHSEPKVWPQFLQEYQQEYFSDPALPPLFACHAGERVGFLRFKAVPHPLSTPGRTVDISINIAPTHRKRGLGIKTLQALTEYVKRKGDVDYILAEVKDFNKASANTFLQAGYEFVDTHQKHIEDIDLQLPVLRFIKQVAK